MLQPVKAIAARNTRTVTTFTARHGTPVTTVKSIMSFDLTELSVCNFCRLIMRIKNRRSHYGLYCAFKYPKTMRCGFN
jgi:hypothetical protein